MRPLSLLLLLLLLSYCTHARFYKARGAKPQQIDSLYFFEPVGGVGLISWRNELQKSDSLSALNVRLQKRVLAHHADRLKLAMPVLIEDSLLQKRVDLELLTLMRNARKGRYLEGLGHPSIIDSIMDAGHKRFALLLFNQGFVRTAENKRWLARQVNPGSLLAAVLGGAVGTMLVASLSAKESFFSPSLNSSSDLYVMIVDAQENRTYFFNSNFSHGSLDYDPSDVEDVNVQFRTNFEGFFFPESNSPRV